MKIEHNSLFMFGHSLLMISFDRDFYIRGRHEGADNSLCKS